jgi:hypothetical protein
MMPGDVSSRHDHHRADVRADEERARIEKLARSLPLREGGIRVPAASPREDDIARFQSLLSRRDSAATQSPVRSGSAAAGNETRPASSADPHAAAAFDKAFARADVGRRDPRRTDAEHDAHSAPAQPSGEAETARGATAQAGEGAQAPRDPRAPAPRSQTSSSQSGTASSNDADKSDGTDAPTSRGRNEASPRVQHAQPGKDEEAAAAAASGSEREFFSTDEDKNTGVVDAVGVPTQISAEVASLAQNQRLIAEAPQQAAMTASSTFTPALAELIEKHVKQMLVSAPSSRLRAREILLRMHDDVLPGTDLWLTQTSGGWSLRADVRSRDAYDALVAGSGDLIERFADHALGELTIEPMYHGEGFAPAADALSSQSDRRA